MLVFEKLLQLSNNSLSDLSLLDFCVLNVLPVTIMYIFCTNLC